MTWTAPAQDRADVPHTGDERAQLAAWLDFHRATLLTKCAGLTGAQLATASVPPSRLTLLGLVRHLAEVERYWFRRVLDDEPVPSLFSYDTDADADFHDLDPDRAEADFATYRAEVAAARAAAGRHDLDATVSSRGRPGGDFTARWVHLHMVEEYARHNGHADLIRERIDGAAAT
ncbi:DinB family protein [Pilimelia terevasa]|nr:DinB family protein [Pilimelia terevasa]